MPRIIIDENIPLIRELLDPFASVEYLSHKDITAATVKDADALIIRTRTKCNESLLKNSRVKFIATATIGIDHIDQEYCRQNNITWVSAPGCNAMSVKQYVMAALLHLASQKNADLTQQTLGIIGVGNVGSKIKDMAQTFGMKVLLNDPPRARNEGQENFVPLDTLLNQADIITVHVPLIQSGEDKTLHLFHAGMEGSVKKGTWFINSSRGEVVAGDFVKKALEKNVVDAAVLDVWENEPKIDTGLLTAVDIATPHIAGYSIDGKTNATEQCVRAACRFFEWDESTIQWNALPEPANKLIATDGKGKSEQDIIHEAIRATYDIMEDDKNLRTNPADFEKLRNNYGIRREPLEFDLQCSNIPGSTIKKLETLGFNVNN